MLWRGEAGSQYLTHRALIHLHLSLTALHEELMHFISLFTYCRNPHMGLIRHPCGSWEVKRRFSRALSVFTGTFYRCALSWWTEGVRMRQDIWSKPKSSAQLCRREIFLDTPGNTRIFAPDFWTWISHHKEDYSRTPHAPLNILYYRLYYIVARYKNDPFP